MKDSLLVTITNSWKCFPWLKPEKRETGTLTAFVRDTEHELLSVLTALQAHVDLLHDEQVQMQRPIDHFTVVNRAISRLIKDTTALASVSELVHAPQSQQKQMLEGLMQEITAETQLAFNSSQVTLSCDIAAGTTIIGAANPLKVMIKGIVLTLLRKCHRLETIRIIGLNNSNHVSLSFDTGLQTNQGIFTPWRLGELRLLPTNGEGIDLAAIAAMARLQHGQLSVQTFSDQRQGYKLSFSI